MFPRVGETPFFYKKQAQKMELVNGPAIRQTHPRNCMSFISSLPPFGHTGQPSITTERLITGQVESLMQFILFDLFLLVRFGNNDAPSELQKPDVWLLTFHC